MKSPALVRAVRERLQLTQAQLGAILGRHSITVSNWERGKWTPNAHDAALLLRFAEAKIKGVGDLLERRGPIYCLQRILGGK